MKKIKFLILPLLFILVSCGGGSNQVSSNNIDLTYVYGSLKTPDYIETQSAKDFGIRYILAATYENGSPLFVTGFVDYAGNYEINLKRGKTYSFVLFDKNLQPVAYVRRGDKNAVFLNGKTVKIDILLIDSNSDGKVDTGMPEIKDDEKAQLRRDERFSYDRNFNQKPDLLETDKNKNKQFDGIEDRNKDGYPDTMEDNNTNNIPDVLEEKEKEKKHKKERKKDKDKKKKDDDDDDHDEEEEEEDD